MSKFCGNCGAELDDSAQVCGFCGVSLNDNFVKKIIPGITSQADEEKIKKAKDLTKKFAPLAGLLVVVILAICIIPNFVGYKGAIRKIMNGFENCDAAALIEMRSGLYGEDFDDDFEEEFQEDLDDLMEEFEEEVGNNVKIKYQIDVIKDVSDKKIEKANDKLADDDDISIKEISEAKKVKFKVTLKGDDKEKHKKEYDEAFEMYLVKEDGSWKYYKGHLFE